MLPPPFIFLLLVVCVGGIYVGRVGFKLRRLTSRSCSDLIQNMCYIDMTEICRLAKGVENPSHGGRMQPLDMVDKLGGPDGLRRLNHNAESMIDLARYLILMKPQDCDLAQAVRRDATTVRRMVKILRWQARFRMLKSYRGVSIQVLAKNYVLVSVNTMNLCLEVYEEIFPLLQEFNNIQARLERVGSPLAGDVL